jgi:hypothetical protein
MTEEKSRAAELAEQAEANSGSLPLKGYGSMRGDPTTRAILEGLSEEDNLIQATAPGSLPQSGQLHAAEGEEVAALSFYRWMLAQKALNQIDDGFEYRFGDEKSRAFVHKVLADYTAAIQKIPPPVALEVASLRFQVEALKAALKPFANEATDWGDIHQDDFHPMCDVSGFFDENGERAEKAAFTVGDLRRALSVFSENQQ